MAEGVAITVAAMYMVKRARMAQMAVTQTAIIIVVLEPVVLQAMVHPEVHMEVTQVGSMAMVVAPIIIIVN